MSSEPTNNNARLLASRRAGAYVLLAMLSLSVHAQQMTRPSPEITRQYHRATQNTVAEILRLVDPVLSTEQRHALRRVSIEVEADSWNLYGIRADEKDGRKLVYIPLGLVILLDSVDSAVVAGQIGRIDQRTVNAYVSAVNHTISENVERGRKGERLVPLPEFPAFASISRARWSKIVSDGQFTSMKEFVKISSFTAIVLHEVAHHILPEANAARPATEREAAADVFAVQTALRAEINPMFALYTFGLFSTLEEQERASGSGYEPAICRGLLFVLRGLKAASSDRGFVEYMKANGKWRDFENAPARIKSVLKEDRVSCPSINEELGAAVQ